MTKRLIGLSLTETRVAANVQKGFRVLTLTSRWRNMKRRWNCKSNLVTALGDSTTCLFQKKKDSSTCVRTRNTEHKKGIRHEKKFFWMHIGGWTEKHSSPIDCPSPCFSICYLLVPPSLCFYFWLTSDQLNCLIYCSCAPIHQVTIGQWCCDVVYSCVIWTASLLRPMHFLEVATALWVGHAIISEFRFCNYFARIWTWDMCVWFVETYAEDVARNFRQILPY